MTPHTSYLYVEAVAVSAAILAAAVLVNFRAIMGWMG